MTGGNSDTNSTNLNNLNLPIFESTVSNSLIWRLWHSINYMLGGILFVFGSLVYYPPISKIVSGDVCGGWLFTIGSLNFLLADLTEWNHFKLGCLIKYKLKSDKEDTVNIDHLNKTCYAGFRRVEYGLNFFISAILIILLATPAPILLPTLCPAIISLPFFSRIYLSNILTSLLL